MNVVGDETNLNHVVLALGEELIGRSRGELESVGVGQGRPVPGEEWPGPVKVLDVSQVVGQTLQVVPGQYLLVTVEVLLAPVALGETELIAVEEERILVSEPEVVGVQANVLGEVVQALLVVVLVGEVVVRVVVGNDVGVVAGAVLGLWK